MRRWVRIARCTVKLADTVEDLTGVGNMHIWRVVGKLSEKLRL